MSNPPPPPPDPSFANLQRGSLLLNQGRAKDALPFFQAAIAANPDAAYGYAELARCYNDIPAQRTKSIGAINRAISLAPGNSHFHGLKGWFLVCLLNYRGAFTAAQQGLAINPVCYQSLNALANAHTKLGQWKKAEAACRRILALNPNDAPGLNLLAQALRHEGRWKEARETAARILAQMPNNAFGHANAGYGALAAGDHLRANEHFLESLRLNPHFDLARRGLLESLRARIWIIRSSIRLIAWTRQKFNQVSPANFLGAVFLLLALVAFGLSHASPSLENAFYELLGILFCGLLCWVYLLALAAILGNFLLLFDSLGRHALARDEKIKSSMVAALYLVITLGCYANRAWIAAASLTILFLILAFSIHYPLLKDRWQRHREKASEPLKAQPDGLE